MNALNVITLMPSTKQQQVDFSTQVINSVINGEFNALELDIHLKSIEDTIKLIRINNQVKGSVMDECDKYPTKNIELLGAKITRVSKATYDFSEDSEYNELNEELTAAKGNIKQRETFLKALTKEVADPITGELIYPPAMEYTDYLKITF